MAALNDGTSNTSDQVDRSRVNEEILLKWDSEQEELKKKIIKHDTEPWQILRLIASDIDNNDEVYDVNKRCGAGSVDHSANGQEDSDVGKIEASESSSACACTLSASLSSVSLSQHLQYVGGVDLSYLKDETTACAALVVCKMPSLEVVYAKCRLVRMSVPYVAGFLGFREAPLLVEAVRTLIGSDPHLKPQVILVDGNGVLHKRQAGLACHIGVSLDIPTVGVAKNLYFTDTISKDTDHINKIASLEEPGDNFPLITDDGTILAKALKTCKPARKPVYVSIGHRIGLETAAWVVMACSKYRVPEPIRMADQKSREHLRDQFPETAKATTTQKNI